MMQRRSLVEGVDEEAPSEETEEEPAVDEDLPRRG